MIPASDTVRHRRRFLAGTLATLAMALTWTAGPAPAAERTSSFPDIQRVLDAGELRVAVLGRDFPPMVLTGSGGELSGFDVRLARDLAARIGVSAVFIRNRGTFDDVIDTVAAGQADIGVSFLSRTVQRAERVLFSKPYAVQNVIVMVNRRSAVEFGGECPTEKEILAHAQTPGRIGVVGRTAYEAEALRAVPDENLVRFDDFPSMEEAVAAGSIDMAYQGELSARQFLHEDPSKRIMIRICPAGFERDHIAIAVRPDAPNLVRLVNIWLDNREMLLNAEDIIRNQGKSAFRP